MLVSAAEECRTEREDDRTEESSDGLRGQLSSSPFAQLLQKVKDLLWLFGQTVLA